MNSSTESNAANRTEEEESGEADDLCTACLTPYGRLAYFCPRCGAPINTFASTLPFERTLAEGYAYRQAVESPRKFIVVAGIWVIFLPTALTSAVVLAQFGWHELEFSPEQLLTITSAVTMFVVSVILVTRTTVAYLRRRAADRKSREA
jgi:hypothetical protein